MTTLTAGALLRTLRMRSVTNCGRAEPCRPTARPFWAAAAPAAAVLAAASPVRDCGVLVAPGDAWFGITCCGDEGVDAARESVAALDVPACKPYACCHAHAVHATSVRAAAYLVCMRMRIRWATAPRTSLCTRAIQPLSMPLLALRIQAVLAAPLLQRQRLHLHACPRDVQACGSHPGMRQQQWGEASRIKSAMARDIVWSRHACLHS